MILVIKGERTWLDYFLVWNNVSDELGYLIEISSKQTVQDVVLFFPNC